MNIFNWAQDNNITWIENIDWWLICNINWLYRIINPHNQLNSKRAEKICRKMFNHMGFHWGDQRICRLIGFGDDEEDFYYITKDSSGKIIWHSMVGGFCTLKGRIPNHDYKNLEYGCPPEKEFWKVFEPKKFSFENFSDAID
jgi:hypothetical protein